MSLDVWMYSKVTSHENHGISNQTQLFIQQFLQTQNQNNIKGLQCYCFVRGAQQWLVNSLYKDPVTRNTSHIMRSTSFNYGPLTRYIKLRVVHAPGMPATFSPPPRVSDRDMHYGMRVTHVPFCRPGSLTSGFLWSQWREKRPRHSRRMRNPQFYVCD